MSIFCPFISNAALISDCWFYIEDCLCIFVKKFLTNKFALQRPAGRSSTRRRRDLSLAAATTAAAAIASAIFTTAVVQHIQFVHSFHLLSYRRLSIDLTKKIGGSARLLSNLTG
jgi:hypothetical protein